MEKRPYYYIDRDHIFWLTPSQFELAKEICGEGRILLVEGDHSLETVRILYRGIDA